MDWTSILPGSTGTFGPWANNQPFFGSLSPPQPQSAPAQQPQQAGPPLQLNPPGLGPNVPQQPQGNLFGLPRPSQPQANMLAQMGQSMMPKAPPPMQMPSIQYGRAPGLLNQPY